MQGEELLNDSCRIADTLDCVEAVPASSSSGPQAASSPVQGAVGVGPLYSLLETICALLATREASRWQAACRPAACSSTAPPLRTQPVAATDVCAAAGAKHGGPPHRGVWPAGGGQREAAGGGDGSVHLGCREALGSTEVGWAPGPGAPPPQAATLARCRLQSRCARSSPPDATHTLSPAPCRSFKTSRRPRRRCRRRATWMQPPSLPRTCATRPPPQSLTWRACCARTAPPPRSPRQVAAAVSTALRWRVGRACQLGHVM